MNARALVPLLLSLTMGLAACDTFMGTPPPPPLPGKRIPVLQLDTQLSADPAVADQPIKLPPPMPTPNWPQAGGLVDKAMQHVAAPGPLHKIWSKSIGEGQTLYRRMVATPVVALGRVYTFDAGTTVTALDASTGKFLWKFNTRPKDANDSGWGGGLAFYHGRLYVTTGYGQLIALDGATGKEYWRVTLGPPVRTPPTVTQGRIFLVTSDNQLQARDADTGKLLWTHRGIEEMAALLGGGAPAVSGSTVVAAYSSGEIYALQVENGRVIWSDSLAFASRIGSLAALNDINASPIIDHGRVFAIGHGGRMAAIDLATGGRIWDRDITGVETPWIAGNYLFVVTSDGKVVCLSSQDGRIHWVTSLPRYKDPKDKSGPIQWSGPLLAGNRLLVTGTDGSVVSISPYTGKELGTVKMDSGIPLAPIAANQIVYLVESSGNLVALK